MSYPKNRKQRPILDRFEEKYIPEPMSGCWIWIGAKSCGYGHIGIGRRGEGQILAHRFSYEHHRGPIPTGYDLDHLCRNTACVNPSHLEAVTHQVNADRGLTGQYVRTEAHRKQLSERFKAGKLGIVRNPSNGRILRVCAS